MKNSTPLVLTQVCASWRKACIRIPQLWSTLRLSLNMTHTLPRFSPFASSSSTSPSSTSSASALLVTSPAKRSPQALYHLASLWFERARHQLLSVSIKVTSTETTHPTDVSFALQPILENARSIRHLAIHVTCASQLAEFFTSPSSSSLKHDFINLESLSLSVQNVDIVMPITTFCNSPRLSRVEFDVRGCPPSLSLIHLPWSSVEVFEMTGASIIPADVFQLLLMSCGNLRKATVWVEDATGADLPTANTTTAVTTLEHLTHLSISFYGRHKKTASSLLSSFNLPHLRHFHFFSGFITLPFLPSITSHRLETLVASGVNIPAAELSALATLNPSLDSLSLDLRYFESEEAIERVLEVLADRDEETRQPRTFPRLQKLSLWTRDISPHSEVYYKMIRSRSSTGGGSGGGYVGGRGTWGVNRLLRFSFCMYLARRQHGVCCHFATCRASSSSSSSLSGGGGLQLDEIMAFVHACEKLRGVDFYLKDVKPDEGIQGFP